MEYEDIPKMGLPIAMPRQMLSPLFPNRFEVKITLSDNPTFIN
tara:strand:- start:581 stop:709 length:129 start_codon:yes stop_codon:yes gene_type:complete